MTAEHSIRVDLQNDDFCHASEYQTLRDNNLSCGAIVTFTGLVREFTHDTARQQTVQYIELQHYPVMTENSIIEIAGKVAAEFKIHDVRIIHRIGKLYPNDQIVLVGVASPHRQEAFLAAEMLMDYLKSQTLLWKKEIRQSVDNEGKLQQESVWIEPKERDYDALTRWQKKPS